MDRNLSDQQDQLSYLQLYLPLANLTCFVRFCSTRDSVACPDKVLLPLTERLMQLGRLTKGVNCGLIRAKIRGEKPNCIVKEREKRTAFPRIVAAATRPL